DSISLINTVPSAIRELIQGEVIPQSAGTICLAGEPLPQSVVEAIHKSTKVKVIRNLYGPTEDTTYSTGATIQNNDNSPPTIGRSLSNRQLYILDKNLNRVPTGVIGEIYLAGSGLARGYLKRPDLTAERFVPNPFSLVPGDRMYKTGDLARYLADGSVQYHGRADHQIKIRGHRIELGEVEAA